MKRLHIHVSVDDLPASIRFYSASFATEPSVTQSDYAKWMLDDPRVNFAISQRIQSAELPQLTQTNASCCYAKSDKHWSIDPNGIPWETFHTLDSIPTFGADTREVIEEPVSEKPTSACCAQTPMQKAASKLATTNTGSSCC